MFTVRKLLIAVSWPLCALPLACAPDAESHEDGLGVSSEDAVRHEASVAPVVVAGSELWQGIYDRARSVNGFSYKWGGASWDPNGATDANRGVCTPLDANGCPNCTHEGQWGADCSGFLSKAWGVPDGNTDVTSARYVYAAPAFTVDSAYWSTIDVADATTGDAIVNRSHVRMVWDPGSPAQDGWYSMECMGCKWGCGYFRQARAVDTSNWHAISRVTP